LWWLSRQSSLDALFRLARISSRRIGMASIFREKLEHLDIAVE
jgi:hypothetical protein